MPNVIGGSNIGDGPTVIGGSNISEEHHHHHDHDEDSLTAPRSFAQTVGDGATTVFAITHNLGTLDTTQEVYNPLTGAAYVPGTDYTVAHTTAAVTTITFAVAPAVGAARVVVKA
jgi:hypothetical protein